MNGRYKAGPPGFAVTVAMAAATTATLMAEIANISAEEMNVNRPLVVGLATGRLMFKYLTHTRYYEGETWFQSNAEHPVSA